MSSLVYSVAPTFDQKDTCIANITRSVGNMEAFLKISFITNAACETRTGGFYTADATTCLTTIHSVPVCGHNCVVRRIRKRSVDTKKKRKNILLKSLKQNFYKLKLSEFLIDKALLILYIYSFRQVSFYFSCYSLHFDSNNGIIFHCKYHPTPLPQKYKNQELCSCFVKKCHL